MGLVKVFRADGQRRNLRKGRRGPQTTLFDVLDLVVGDEMLSNTSNGERKRLRHVISTVEAYKVQVPRRAGEW